MVCLQPREPTAVPQCRCRRCSRSPRALDPDDIQALARRVAELLRASTSATEPLVDAAELARILGVDRDWVYARAGRLGAVRLGDGPKARLRFDIERVRATLAPVGPGKPPPRDEPP